MDDIKAAFQKYDADKSGSITPDEAYLVLKVSESVTLDKADLK